MGRTTAPTEPHPTLVYLPGLDGTGRLLYRQPRLHELYDVRCVAYPQAAGHSYDELVNLAAQQLESSGEGVVLAESFGGAVALLLALRRPDLVRRLVLVNTFAHFPRRPLIGLFATLGRFLPAKPSHPATRRLRGIFFFSRDVPAGDQREWWERTADVPMQAFGWRFGMIAGLDLRPRLAEIAAPALVVAACDDRVVPSCAGKTLARLLPSARLLCPRAGHAALVHPRIDVAQLLQDETYWPAASAAATSARPAGARRG
jgi:pimeloyl-ACP methyl ester carboxylesterase